jgi:putative methanogenesis marker protein 8
MTKHKVEMAKSRVLIEDGKVKVLSPPMVKRCPLRRHLYGCESENASTVKRVLESHIQELGMYTSKRVLSLRDDPVSFGASEMMNDALREGLLDAAVVVCEGVGTVVTARPEVLQAVGAHMTGVLETEEIPSTKRRLERKGALTLGSCQIDQVRGYEIALEHGYERVAVTISGDRASDATAIRAKGKELGNRPIILAVHTTGISKTKAAQLAKGCDVVWGCASKWVREVAGPKALIQIGTGIPVFAMTIEGKKLVLNRALHMSDKLLIGRSQLPALDKEKQPEPLL